MITWNYRVFQDKDEYCIREVFYLDNGTIGGCTERRITPTGNSLDDLARDIENFQEALKLPVLTLEEIDAIVAEQPLPPPRDRSQNISLEQLVTELNLDWKEQDAVGEDLT